MFEKKYKYILENTLHLISLHDCYIEKIFIENGNLNLYMSNIDIFYNHPLNPYEVPRCTGNAMIRFKDFELIDVLKCYPERFSFSFVTGEYKEEKEKEEHYDNLNTDEDIQRMFNNMQISSFEKGEEAKEYFVYDFFCLQRRK